MANDVAQAHHMGVHQRHQRVTLSARIEHLFEHAALINPRIVGEVDPPRARPREVAQDLEARGR